MGRTPCCDKNKVKRGAWSPEEDAILKDYLYKHGTGNWIALPRKAGLRRCGKSCRLRWLNYLRPDIKHGAFTQEEESIIFSLYNRIGSRWSVIASHLQGRTDNDVKNYWNTKLKKKFVAANNNTRTTTSTSNAASATATFDITTTLRKDSWAFPSAHLVPFLPHNCISTSLSANTTCTSCDQAINFHSPTFFLEWSSDFFSSPFHQESELLRSSSFGMGASYGVKGIPVNEDPLDVMGGSCSQVEGIGSGSNADLFSIFQC